MSTPCLARCVQLVVLGATACGARTEGRDDDAYPVSVAATSGNHGQAGAPTGTTTTGGGSGVAGAAGGPALGLCDKLCAILAKIELALGCKPGAPCAELCASTLALLGSCSEPYEVFLDCALLLPATQFVCDAVGGDIVSGCEDERAAVTECFNGKD